MPKESSMMMKAPTRSESRWAGRGVRLKCVEEMVVIGLICVFIGFVSFVSKPSLSLIIKWYVQTAWLSNQGNQFLSNSLIIKEPDNQAQDLKCQINQYLSEILIVTLATATHGFNYPVFRYYSAILAFSAFLFSVFSGSSYRYIRIQLRQLCVLLVAFSPSCFLTLSLLFSPTCVPSCVRVCPLGFIIFYHLTKCPRVLLPIAFSPSCFLSYQLYRYQLYRYTRIQLSGVPVL